MLGLGTSARFILQSFILRKRQIIFYSLIVGLLVVGSALVYYSEHLAKLHPGLSGRFLDEVGKALLIAGILAGSVDIYLKRRLASDFVRDVAPFIEGMGLPQEFQDEIAFIRRLPIYRKNLWLRYRIERMPPPKQGYVRLLTTVSCEVLNATDETQEFRVNVFCENAYPEVGESKILAAGADDERGQVFRYSQALQNLAAKIEKKGPMLVLSEQIALRPKMGSTLYWADMESYEETSGSDIFYLSDPTVDITVSVEAPKDFEVEVFIGHRLQADEPSKIQQIPPPPDTTHTWHMAAAMLTWHSIYIRWKGANAPAPAHPTATGQAEVGRDEGSVGSVESHVGGAGHETGQGSGQTKAPPG